MKMKKLITILTMLCGLIGAALLIPGCKEARIPENDEIQYSIQGDWGATRLFTNEFSPIFDRYPPLEMEFQFTGTNSSGTVTVGEYTGTYTVGGVTGDQVKISFSYYEDDTRFTEDYIGAFTNSDQMTGTFDLLMGSEKILFGTWGAQRK